MSQYMGWIPLEVNISNKNPLSLAREGILTGP